MRQSVRRIVPHPRERLFDLVADVESYPSFLPMWQQARIVSGCPEHYCTEQSLGIGPARLDFKSETYLECPNRILVIADHPPVRRLRLDWSFSPLGDDRCQVSLNMVVEVQSRMLQKLIQAMSGDLVPRLISSFEARARAVSRGEVVPNKGASVGAAMTARIEPARSGLQ